MSDPLREGKVRRARERAARRSQDTPHALWAYGPEGAPTDDAEADERALRRMWRAFDRDPRAFVRLPNGYKRSQAAPQ